MAPPKAEKINEDSQTPQAASPVELGWEDLTPDQQQIVLWGREEPTIEMPKTARTLEQIRAWRKSIR